MLDWLYENRFNHNPGTEFFLLIEEHVIYRFRDTEQTGYCSRKIHMKMIFSSTVNLSKPKKIGPKSVNTRNDILLPLDGMSNAPGTL